VIPWRISSPSHLQHCLQLGVLRRPQAGHRRKLRLAGSEHAVQAAESTDQLAPQIDGAFSLDANAQENCQQFGIRQGCRTMGEQAFTWSLVLRPVANRHLVTPSNVPPCILTVMTVAGTPDHGSHERFPPLPGAFRLARRNRSMGTEQCSANPRLRPRKWGGQGS